MTTAPTTEPRRWVLPTAALVIALVVIAPLLGQGFALSYDMVFSPRQWLLPDSVGLGSTLPRAVPVDAVVALATTVLPGDLLQQAVLLLTVFAAALGAGRLVPTHHTGTRLVAATTYAWSPFLAERLFIGHWSLLLAYACLPWIAMAAMAVRDGEPKAWPRLAIACLPAVLTPTGGILAAGVALALVGRSRLLPAAAILLVLNAPWWVPSVTHPGGGLSDPLAVALFGARSENWGGTITSVLGLGGVWNSEVVPTSRTLPLIPVITLALVAIALLGLRTATRRLAVPLVCLGAFGVLLATVGTLPFGHRLLVWLIDTVPGAGLLRDSQKWVAWWALPLAVGFALGVEWAAARLHGKAGPIAMVGAALLPVAVLPDLAFAGWGRLEGVRYPADWQAVAEVLATDERPGDVLTLPMSTFRRFAWNDNRTQLDPAPRVLPRPTVIDDTLVVGGRAIAGEDVRVAAIRRTLAEHGDLARDGIGWVLVEHGTPGVVDPETLRDLTVVHRGDWLTLYRVPGVPAETATGPPRVPVLVADFAALTLAAFSLLWRGLPMGRLTAGMRRVRRP